MKHNEIKFNKQNAADNPFVTSKSFFNLIKMVAGMSRVTLKACASSSEAVNMTLSIIVTFLKNIPESLWELMKKVATEEDQNEATRIMFAHLDGLRGYKGKDGDKFTEIRMNIENDDDVPEFTTKPPTQSI